MAIRAVSESFYPGYQDSLFILLGLPSTLIRNENGALQKRSSDWKNLKKKSLRLEFTENFLRVVCTEA